MKTKNIKQRILEYFFMNPTARLRVRQIERVVDVPLPSAIRYTKELMNEGLLKIVEVAAVRAYAADRASQSYRLEKTFFNIRRLHESGLVEHLRKELDNPTIILFGSYAKGEDTESSDVDLFIKTRGSAKVDMEPFEKKLNRTIQLFTGTKLPKNRHLANNIINGITLNGFLEVL
ncbi:MAG: nucleotidyltransferase domain-containing protein [Nanoarchaeota archaeon]|nr:nucleotidyltransferase domain-containing protein [Nanoarchaeota archaeon]